MHTHTYVHTYIREEQFETRKRKSDGWGEKDGVEKRETQKAERKRERAVSGSGRYYRKRVGGRVRTTFLFSQNSGGKCRLLALSSLSKELGRRQIFNAIHLSTLH